MKQMPHRNQPSSLSRRIVPVSLGERSYQIVIGADLLEVAGELIRSTLGPPTWGVAVISNPTVFDRYGQKLTKSLAQARFRVVPHLMADGERYKTLKTVESIHRSLAQHHVDRHCAVVALGGGVVGDVAGFVAASFLRGLAFVQIPTTLLAAIDSSIGGKTGVNLPEGKNLVGAFYQPRLVITDINLLQTLPPRELKAALYEAIKYGIMADPDLFDLITQAVEAKVPLRGDRLIELIAWCCQIKAQVVAGDEREAGQRQILNLGHTFGHALEAATWYRRFKHGEAVGYGLILAARLAHELGLIESSNAHKIEAGVRSIGRLPSIADPDADAWVEAMRHDKKVRRDQLTFILPTRIGAVKIVTGVPDRLVKKTIRQLLRSRSR
jgi:3-dehydroquinate synthase